MPRSLTHFPAAHPSRHQEGTGGSDMGYLVGVLLIAIRQAIAKTLKKYT